jgi:tRNA(His) 5'-end guanylyltransferase
MDAAARAVVEEFTDIVLAYGQSDEYRYALPKIWGFPIVSRPRTCLRSLTGFAVCKSWPYIDDDCHPACQKGPAFFRREMPLLRDE